jgi:hypothetical protein
MLSKFYKMISGLVFVFFVCGGISSASAQTKDDKKTMEIKSVGGKEHESNILGVTIGMDVQTALESVFLNANLSEGQEKPNAKRNEGKDNRDVRVVYKNLKQGELQIVFADGKFVKEMILVYANKPLLDDLRLPFTGSLGNSSSLTTSSTVALTPPNAERGELSTNTSVLDGTREIDGFNATNLANTDRRRGEALDGTRYDDRYSIAFTDNQKLQRLWWREEKATQNFKIRIQFISEKNTNPGAKQVVKILQKAIFLDGDNEKLFRKQLDLQN